MFFGLVLTASSLCLPTKEGKEGGGTVLLVFCSLMMVVADLYFSETLISLALSVNMFSLRCILMG